MFWQHLGWEKLTIKTNLVKKSIISPDYIEKYHVRLNPNYSVNLQQPIPALQVIIQNILATIKEGEDV
jgi:hypothetical protein